MRFSVVIPTCNRNQLLAKCLDALAPGVQAIGAEAYEVIVSDDGKHNEAKALLAEHYRWATWVEGPKRGPAANRNCGARLATGEWLVFTDDDCLPDTNWLNAYAEAVQQHPECRAFEGAILPDDWALLKKDMAECPVNTTGGCFWSANIMVQQKLYWEAGGFDEQFKIAAQEDQDLQERILPKTIIHFIGNSIVIHPVRFGKLLKRLNHISITAINWHGYYRKNHNFLKTVLKGANSQFLALLHTAKKGKPQSGVYHLIYFLIVVPILFCAEVKCITRARLKTI